MPVRPDPVPILAADVGGTKTNVGLFTPGRERPRLIVDATYPSADFEDLAAVLSTFLADRRETISLAAIAVAGPVIRGRSQVTNLPWRIHDAALEKAFGWSRVALVNDLAAMATAVPYLRSRESIALNTRRRPPGQNLALVAPGTGLGTALLVATAAGYQVVASEGGHADWAPTAAEDLDLWRFLHERFGHLSGERLVAGAGLANIYDWLAARGRWPVPSWLAAIPRPELPQAIAQGALERNDPLCRAALDKFVGLLGAIAGNLALTGMATGGVFLGGGIPPKILPALQGPHFMANFQAKGCHRDLMERIPVRVITNPRTGLLGAAIHGFQTLAS